MSKLAQLTKEAQGMGFYFHASVDGQGYKTRTSTGFKGYDELNVRSSSFPYTLEKFFVGPNTEFSEILSWRTLIEEKRGWFGLRAKEAPFKSQLILDNGTSEEGTLDLIYGWAAVEPDHVGRPAYAVQGLVAPASLVKLIIDSAWSEPQNIGLVFHGKFPKLEARYHPNPNGKILIASEETIMGGNLAKHIQDYEAKGE